MLHVVQVLVRELVVNRIVRSRLVRVLVQLLVLVQAHLQARVEFCSFSTHERTKQKLQGKLSK